MNENIFNTLDAIDEVKSSALDTQIDVLVACDNAYNKYCLFSESYSGDVDDLDFFTEGSVGEEYKKMKGENENIIVSILMALPRFIAAIIKSITKKTEHVEEELDKVDTDESTKKRAATISEIIDDYNNNGARGKFVKKLEDVLKKVCKVSILTGLTGGVVLHFFPPKQTIVDSEGKSSVAKKVPTLAGFEVCVTKEGKIKMTNEFITVFEEINKEYDATKKSYTEGRISAKEASEKLAELEPQIDKMTKFAVTYNDQDAKVLGVVGVKAFFKKSIAWCFNSKEVADRMGADFKAKAADSNAVARAGASVVDRVLRSLTLIGAQMQEYTKLIAEALIKLAFIPIEGVKEFLKNEPGSNKSIVDTAKEKISEIKDKKKKDADEGEDEVIDLEPSEPDIEGESFVDEMSEDQTVTQESADDTNDEPDEPVDPVVSSWYNK